MQFGLGQLRLSSENFWTMSLCELNAAAGIAVRWQEAPSRQILTALMRAFPDE